MFRSVYPFKKTHPTSLSFAQGDLFVELTGASKDKNWHYVLNSVGESGYVPRNYVVSERVGHEELLAHMDALKDKIRLRDMVKNERAELLANLDGVRNKAAAAAATAASSIAGISRLSSSHTEVDHGLGCGGMLDGARSASPRSNASSSGRSTPPKSSKKRAAPKPPSAAPPPQAATYAEVHVEPAKVVDLPRTEPVKTAAAPPIINALQQETRRRRPSSTSASSSRRASAAAAAAAALPDPSREQLRSHARDLVELVRVETGLSHANSQSVVRSVLGYAAAHLPRLDRNLPAMLDELERPVLADKVDVAASADTKAMEKLLGELTAAKEDDQQRNWRLHEDEHVLADLLRQLSSSLQNSDPRVSVYVIARFKYFYVHNLVEYYQMEGRWSLKRLLIENFLLMASLDSAVAALLLASSMPAELWTDVTTAVDAEDAARVRAASLLLTVALAAGGQMPVHYFEVLGENFVDFMLDRIEDPPEWDIHADLPEVFTGLVLGYNLQFYDVDTNIVLTCLAKRRGAKVWTEKVLLLLNREEDPTAVVTLNSNDDDGSDNYNPNAPRKMVLDMFQHSTAHKLFYTNDVLVLLDIVVRQLSDLSAGDRARTDYIRLCRLLLLRSNYSEHRHRKSDLEKCFRRILQEEDETPEDAKEIKMISQEVSNFSHLINF